MFGSIRRVGRVLEAGILVVMSIVYCLFPCGLFGDFIFDQHEF
jgi:hypothetical protein